MVLTDFKCNLKNKCGLDDVQMKLIILSMFTIIFQGVGLYLIDKKGIKSRFFIFVVIFGFLYNIMYYKTYL